MKRSIKLRHKPLIIASLVAILMMLLPPALPVYAWQTHTWDTQADFNAGVLTNVDTSYSPNDVVLATNLDTGNGSDGPLTVPDGFFFIDNVRSALKASTYIGSSYIEVSSSDGFAAGQEILIIQMEGTSAGTWETNFVAGTGVGALILTKLLKNAYHADANSKAQVIKVPNYTNVTINPGGILTCHLWNQFGDWTGGIIIFRATGTVTVSSGGIIDATFRGLNGGSGGASSGGGTGGGGGIGGGDGTTQYPNGAQGWTTGTGGQGGGPGAGIGCAGYYGGDGGQDGNGGNAGQSGQTGQGAGGGASDHGGNNASAANLSLMQTGSGGGGGRSGTGGFGGGGGGGGGYNNCVESKWFKGGPWDGASGGSGGSSGSGGQGGLGGGIIVIYANSIVQNNGSFIKAQGGNGVAGSNGSNGGGGGAGGGGQNWCQSCIAGFCSGCGAGGGGGGGGGGKGGGGGNSGGGGSGGTVWLAANNITLLQNGVIAVGGSGVGGGQGGGGGAGGSGARGGDGDPTCCRAGNGSGGPSGPAGAAGTTGGNGGDGKIRLDYRTLSGSTSPTPGYTSGLYYPVGTIASDVWDTGTPGETWRTLSWAETLHANTDITFQVRASNTSFAKDNNTIPWISAGGTSPVSMGLPSGRYMQWRATLTTSSNFYSPVLHSVTVAYSASPEVTTDAASNVGTSSATLNGTLVALGTSGPSVNVSFEWGTTQGGPYPNSTPAQAMTAPGTFQASLSTLPAGTTHYFRAKADGGTSGTDYGDEMSFQTSTTPPAVITNAASSVSVSSAILNGALISMGTATTVNVSFLWGTTQGGPYPNSTTPQALTSAGSFQANLSNLGPNTTYYFKARGDGGINGTGYGAEMSFTTPKVPPSVTTDDATNITANSATLNGDLANMGTAATVNVSFQWGTTPGGPYPNSTPTQAVTHAVPFNANLSSLSGNTSYYFRAVADGGVHGISYGAEKSFTTSIVLPTVVTIGATGITSSLATLNGNLTALGSASTVDVCFLWGLNSGCCYNATPWQMLSAPQTFQANLASLSPDTTYYFQASALGDGWEVNGDEMSFHTSKVPPSVTTNGATAVTANSATLNGTLTVLGTAPSDNVSFQWGTTSGIYSVETVPQPMVATVDFQANLIGLSPNTTYYYRAKANGGIHGIGYGQELVFTTSKVPPAVTTNNASQITTSGAALNGTLTNLGTATTVNVSFQWGTTQGGPYPNSTTPQAMAATGAFQASLPGLSPHTMYYFRAIADGGIHGISYGAEKSFSTSMFPPYVVTEPATGITANAATLNGTLYFLGSASTVNVSFIYGTTQGGPYPNSTPPQAMTATGAFQANLSVLNSNTTYYYRAGGNGGQYGSSWGDEYRFTTSTLPPSVTTNDASGVTGSAATLNGNLDNLGTATTVNVSFQWGTTSGGPYPNPTSPQAKTSTGAFQANLSGLQGNTTYYFRAEADGGSYGISYGAERTFTTAKIPPTVATDNATAVAATSATLRGNLTALGTASTVNVYFDWGTTQGGPYPNSTPTQAKNSTGAFQANISSLTALTTYYFRAGADGGVHGTAQGAECSFTTGSTPPSVSTGAATSITASSATLNGTLSSLGTAVSDNVSFQWGTSPGVYSHQTDLQVMNAPGDFNANLIGLLDNTTYYYRAAAYGGRHGTSYGTEHAFTTSTLPPSATTNAATWPTTNTAFLNGTLTALGTAPTVNVSFVYGTNAGGPYPNITPPQAKNSTGAFQAGITGLTPFTTYYFKAKADGGIYGTSYGAEMSFTTNHLPPVVGTGGATDIMTNAAILNGNLYLPGTAPTINVSFEYGTTHGGPYSDSTSPQTMTQPEAFQAQLSGLTPATTYYYRAKGDGGVHGIGYGAEHAFTTSAIPPSVTTNNAGNITANSAVLNGTLISLGTATTVNVSFEYGTNQGGPYPNVTPPQAQAAAGAFQASLTNLTPVTAYYFRAMADGGIYGTSYGEERSFITPSTPPSVTTNDATSITQSSAILNGTLVSLGSATMANLSFRWGTTQGGPYPNVTTPQAMAAPGAFQANLNELSQNTIYYFSAKADSGVYGISYGNEMRFTTGTPPPPPPPSHPRSSPAPPQSAPPIMSLQYLNVQPHQTYAGQAITITTNVVNTGSETGNYNIILKINERVEQTQVVSVSPQGTQPVQFTVTRSQPGTYTVNIGGSRDSFTILAAVNSQGAGTRGGQALVVAMAAVIILLLCLVMLLARRRLQGY